MNFAWVIAGVRTTLDVIFRDAGSRLGSGSDMLGGDGLDRWRLGEGNGGRNR